MSKQNKNDTCVYRLYDNDDICLYVGITEDFKVRMNQHENDKEWFIDVNRFEHSEYMNRNQAKIYEIYYISMLKPLYNNDHMSFVDGFNMSMEDLEFKECDYIKSNVISKKINRLFKIKHNRLIQNESLKSIIEAINKTNVYKQLLGLDSFEKINIRITDYSISEVQHVEGEDDEHILVDIFYTVKFINNEYINEMVICLVDDYIDKVLDEYIYDTECMLYNIIDDGDWL